MCCLNNAWCKAVQRKTNMPGLEKIATKHNLIVLAGRKQLHWGWVALVMEQSSLQTVLCNSGNYNGSEQLLIFANLKCTWTSLRTSFFLSGKVNFLLFVRTLGAVTCFYQKFDYNITFPPRAQKAKVKCGPC